VLGSQEQGKAVQDFRVRFIERQHQLRFHLTATRHRFEVEVHFVADAVLVELIQRIARRDAEAADIGEVIDHHLQQLTFDVFARCRTGMMDQ